MGVLHEDIEDQVEGLRFYLPGIHRGFQQERNLTGYFEKKKRKKE